MHHMSSTQSTRRVSKTLMVRTPFALPLLTLSRNFAAHPQLTLNRPVRLSPVSGAFYTPRSRATSLREGIARRSKKCESVGPRRGRRSSCDAQGFELQGISRKEMKAERARGKGTPAEKNCVYIGRVMFVCCPFLGCGLDVGRPQVKSSS